jgi:hypothetical protein
MKQLRQVRILVVNCSELSSLIATQVAADDRYLLRSLLAFAASGASLNVYSGMPVRSMVHKSQTGVLAVARGIRSKRFFPDISSKRIF